MFPDKSIHWLITCEHASCRIPQGYRSLFANHRDLLASHRGWDPGAIWVADQLAKRFEIEPHHGSWSRLLIELNRSLHHRHLFSFVTKTLNAAQRQSISDEFWSPYRSTVSEEVAQAIMANKLVVHLSIHSFTPMLDGVKRNADIGLLFDPRRESERGLVVACAKELGNKTVCRVRRNYPYRGIADGHTTALRKQFGSCDYVGIEVEINQSVIADKANAKRIADELASNISIQSVESLVPRQ